MNDRPWAAGYGQTSEAYDKTAATLRGVSQKFNEHNLDGRRVRERTQLLVEAVRKGTTESLQRSGTTEQFTRLQQLMEEVSQLMGDYERQRTDLKDRERQRVEREQSAAEQMLALAMGKNKRRATTEDNAAKDTGTSNDDDNGDGKDKLVDDGDDDKENDDALDRRRLRKRARTADILDALKPSDEEKQLLKAIATSVTNSNSITASVQQLQQQQQQQQEVQRQLFQQMNEISASLRNLHQLLSKQQ